MAGYSKRTAAEIFKKSLRSPLALSLVMLCSRAAAQEGLCRLVDSTAGPSRQILVCPSGPEIEAESKADIRVQDERGHGRPVGAIVSSGAGLFNVPTDYPGGFQVRTPRAIASVRGTQWVIDVQPQQTSVFVLRGEVDVQPIGGQEIVALHTGEGVDVTDAGRPLDPTRWTPERVAALLARFGR